MEELFKNLSINDDTETSILKTKNDTESNYSLDDISKLPVNLLYIS